MEDYPRTLADFEERFRSEEACRDYLFRVRWPEGFRCPRCGESRAWRLRSALWQCARCAYQASLDCGDDFPGHAHSSEGVVPRSVVDDQPEEWRQRPRSATRVGARCAWQRGTYGWLVGLPASRQQRLPTSDHGLARPTPPFGIAAARPSGHLAVETLAAGHASRGRPSGTCG